MSSVASQVFTAFHTPLIRHVKKRYAWMQQGHCLLDLDDLIQVASIALLKLGSRWESIAADRGISPDPTENDGLVWAYLSHEIRNAIHKYADRTARIDDAKLTGSIDRELERFAEDGWLADDLRTQITVQPRDAFSLLHGDLVDYISVMPQRDKVHLALRYFDGRTLDEAAKILEGKKATVWAYLQRVEDRLRAHAENQIRDIARDEPDRFANPWTPPDALHAYLRNTHDTDLLTWLGHFTICIRLDSRYITDMISGEYFMPSTVRRGAKWTDEQVDEIDRRRTSGETVKAIAADMGIPESTVKKIWLRHSGSRGM